MKLPKHQIRELELFAGIDVGTSKVNLVLLDRRSVAVWAGSVPLAAPDPVAGALHTQRVEVWEAATGQLFAAAAGQIDLSRVAGVGVSATTPTLVFLDAGDRVIDGTAVLWCDPSRKGPAGPTNAGLQKLAAILDHSPHLRDSRSVLDSGNYLCFRLTGERSIGSAALGQKFAWSPEEGCDTTGFDPELLARFPRRVVSTGEVVGALREEPALRWGLRAGIPVVACAYDSVASIPGGGIGTPAAAILLTVGTSVGLYKVLGPSITGALGPWVPRGHLLPDGLRVVAGGFEAGMQSIALVHQRLRLTCKAAESGQELEELTSAAERREPPGCFGLPFGGVALRSPLAGRVLPTAVFSARELAPSDPATLVALRRGVAYFVRYSLDDLSARSVAVGRVHVVGGGTKSPSFCQLLADACGRPVASFGTRAAATGAAILTATARSSRADREQLVSGLVPVAEYTPDRARRSLYDAGYGLFRDHLHAALRRTTSRRRARCRRPRRATEIAPDYV